MAQVRKRSKKWISWVIILVLLIAAGVVVYFVWDNYFRDKKEDAVEQQTASRVEKKKEETKVEDKKEEDASEPEDEKKVRQYEGKDPNESEVLTGAVTYAGVAGSNLVIRVNIDQYLYEGECMLNLVRNGSVVHNATAGITTAASTATCEGFNVPVSGLGSGGLDIVVKISSGGKTGTINGKVEI